MAVLSLAVATALGVGYLPFAPGTWGSVVGLIVWWALGSLSASMQGLVIVVLLVAGSASASVAERHFGRTDPGQIVIDEVAGMLVAIWELRHSSARGEQAQSLVALCGTNPLLIV